MARPFCSAQPSHASALKSLFPLLNLFPLPGDVWSLKLRDDKCQSLGGPEGVFHVKDPGCLERILKFFLVEPKLTPTLNVFRDKRLT